MGSSFELKGAAEVSARLRKVLRASQDRMKQGLRVEAEVNVLTPSKKIVPLDLGPLMNSGHVKPVVRKGDELSVVIAFGGPSAPYALRQHEDPTLTHSAGRTYKYLERPLMEAIPGMVERIAGRILEDA